MSLSDLASLGSFVSGVAVLISLVFLYFQVRQVTAQVRQAERNQQASIRHTRISRAVQLQLDLADPGRSEVWWKALIGPQEISETQLRQFFALSRAFFFHIEDSFYQHEHGLLNDDAFETTVAGIRRFVSNPGARAIWRVQRSGFRGKFLAYMDGLVSAAAQGPPIDILDEWNAACAAEAQPSSPGANL
jgi:hypothetical protein